MHGLLPQVLARDAIKRIDERSARYAPPSPDLRIANGVSQEQLALMAEVDRSYVGRVERGESNVALLTLIRTAAALGITASSLLSDAGL